MNGATEGSLARRVGLVGGLGIAAGIYYYRELAKACDALGIVLDIVLVHADINRTRKYVDSNHREALAEYLARLIGFAMSAGAEVAAIAAVTPHVCIEQLRPRLSLPLIDPLQCARDAIGSRRVALFGTRYTIESDMFGALKGLDVVRPSEAEVQYLHDTYFQIASSGTASQDQRAGLSALARTIVKRNRLDAIVVAGTDLSPIFENTTVDFPFLDCSRIHIAAVMQALHPRAGAASERNVD